MALLDYLLTLECGHKRRTVAPCEVGGLLPCLDESHYGGREFSKIAASECFRSPITHITDKAGRELQKLGWISSQAAMHGAYDDAVARGDKDGQRLAATMLAGSLGIRLPRRGILGWLGL